MEKINSVPEKKYFVLAEGQEYEGFIKKLELRKGSSIKDIQYFGPFLTYLQFSLNVMTAVTSYQFNH